MTDRPHNTIRRRRGRGFTLIEASLVMVIVGIGVLAIVAAQQAYHRHNDYAQRIGTALLLAGEIREVTLNLPLHDPIYGTTTWGPEADEPTITQYDDVDDFDGNGGGVTFNPPITALRLTVADMDRWSQQVSVENVLPNYLTGTAVPDNTTGTVRVTCSVLYLGPGETTPNEVTRLTWIRSE